MRSLCVLAIVIGFAFQGGVAVGQTATAPAEKAGSPLADTTVHRAFDFVDSIGINTQIDAAGTTYQNVDVVAARLKFLGIHYVRDAAFQGGISFEPARFKKLIDAGVKIDLCAGYGDLVNVPTIIKGAEAMEKAYPGSISSIEGHNEVDDKRHPFTFNGKTINQEKGEYDAATDVQAFLYKSVKDSPILKNIPVYAFTFGWFNRSDTAKDASAYADYANVHAYSTNGVPPRQRLTNQILNTKQVRGKPIVMTETGFPTLFPGGPTLKNLVDESVQESFLLDTLFDNFSNGIVRTFLYDLMDRRVNPTDTTDQWHYGIFRADGTPKPMAFGLKNLITIMSAGLPESKDFELSPLAYAVTPEFREPDNKVPNYSSVFEKKPGVYDVVIWSEPVIWDAKAFKLIKDESMNVVTVKFAAAHQTIRVYDPTVRSEPIKTLTDAAQVKLQITDHPFILEVER